MKIKLLAFIILIQFKSTFSQDVLTKKSIDSLFSKRFVFNNKPFSIIDSLFGSKILFLSSNLPIDILLTKKNVQYQDSITLKSFYIYFEDSFRLGRDVNYSLFVTLKSDLRISRHDANLIINSYSQQSAILLKNRKLLSVKLLKN